MDETIILAIQETLEGNKTVLKALIKILDDLEEVKAGLNNLNGKSYDVQSETIGDAIKNMV